MELKDQVVSLESAKRLRELGIKQESLFYWVDWGKVERWQCRYKEYIDTYWDEVIERGYTVISAFTVSELMELCNSKDCFIGTDYDDGAYERYDKPVFCGYFAGFRTKNGFKKFRENSLTECIAKMLIYMIENGIVEVKK